MSIELDVCNVPIQSYWKGRCRITILICHMWMGNLLVCLAALVSLATTALRRLLPETMFSFALSTPGGPAESTSLPDIGLGLPNDPSTLSQSASQG